MNQKNLQTFYIRQSDVDSGTYRIRSGGYYMLAEDICFDPIPELEIDRNDKPKFGWFAVISVETTEKVVINLNTYTIECSQHFVDTHYAKAFGIIVLNNNIYGATTIAPVLTGFNYTNEVGLVNAENTTIKNGRIGRSPHFGIKGFYNININLHDLLIEDFELTGIWIPAYKNVICRNICISGNQHPIRVSTRLSSLFFLQITLGELSAGGFPGAAEQFDIVNRLFRERVNFEFENFVLWPTHTMYGILLVSGVRAAFPTILPKTTPPPPAPQFSCPIVAQRSGVNPAIYPSSNVILSNITIKNLKNNPIEEIATAYGVDAGVILPPGFADQGRPIPTIIYGLFGPIPWTELFGEGPTPCVNGTITNISLSEFARALLFTIFAIQSLPQPPPPAPPRPNILAPDFLTQILFNNTLLSNRVQPLFSVISSLDTKRGNFGIAIYCSKNIKMDNIIIDNIICKGFPNIVPNPRTIPGLSCYQDTVFRTEDGGKSWGIFVDASDNVNINNSKINNVLAFTSDSFGVHFTETVTNSEINNVCVNNIISKFDIGNDPIFNPPSTSYGALIQNTSSNNIICNSTFNNIISPRTAIGIEIENNSHNNIVYKSSVDTVISNSKLLVMGGSTTLPTIEDVAKTATGFASTNSTDTKFECVDARNIIIANESFCQTGPTTSRAAGIALLEGDKGSEIICPEISHLIAGAGSANKIYIAPDVTNYKINKNCNCECECSH